MQPTVSPLPLSQLSWLNGYQRRSNVRPPNTASTPHICRVRPRTVVYGGIVHAHTRQFDDPRPWQTSHRRNLLLPNSPAPRSASDPSTHSSKLPLISEKRNSNVTRCYWLSRHGHPCGAWFDLRSTTRDSPTSISSVPQRLNCCVRRSGRRTPKTSSPILFVGAASSDRPPEDGKTKGLVFMSGAATLVWRPLFRSPAVSCNSRPTNGVIYSDCRPCGKIAKR